MTLSDALKAEWDATRSVFVTFWRSDGIRYTHGATSYFRTVSNPGRGVPRGCGVWWFGVHGQHPWSPTAAASVLATGAAGQHGDLRRAGRAHCRNTNGFPSKRLELFHGFPIRLQRC